MSAHSSIQPPCSLRNSPRIPERLSTVLTSDLIVFSPSKNPFWKPRTTSFELRKASFAETRSTRPACLNAFAVPTTNCLAAPAAALSAPFKPDLAALMMALRLNTSAKTSSIAKMTRARASALAPPTRSPPHALLR